MMWNILGSDSDSKASGPEAKRASGGTPIPAEQSSAGFPNRRASQPHLAPAVKKGYAGLNASTASKPAEQPRVQTSPPPAKRKKTSEVLPRKVFIVGALVIILGVALAVQKLAFDDSTPGSTEDTSQVSTVSTTTTNVNNPVQESSASSGGASTGSQEGPQTQTTATVPAVFNKTRAQDFLDNLLLNGEKPKFAPVDTLRFEKSPLRLLCLLRARLDPETELRWRTIGLLTDNFVPSSFVLSVTVKSQDALDELLDWHVEGVCLQAQLSAPKASE